MAIGESRLRPVRSCDMQSLPARKFDVRQRRRPDPMSISSPADFRYARPRNVDPLSAVSDPSVTLYCLNPVKRQAVFVECDPDVSLSEYPFYYQGQFAHARRAIVISFEQLHYVANRCGDRFQHAVMVHSVGRCGSTLLSKMFARLECCLSLSEPDTYTQIVSERFSSSETVELLRSSNRLYYQPQPGASPSHLVLKFRSFCVELARKMEVATPSAVSIFMYRDVESVVRSGMRVFRYSGAPLWWVDQLHRLVISRPALGLGLWWNRGLGHRLFPALDRFTSWELSRMGPVGVLAVAWVSAMECCVTLARDGMRIPAICYEDLITEPEKVAAGLEQFCNLPPGSSSAMLYGMDADSQRGSVIARDNQKEYELSPGDRDTIRMVLARSDIIDSGEYRIEGTLDGATS